MGYKVFAAWQVRRAAVAPVTWPGRGLKLNDKTTQPGNPAADLDAY